MNILLFGGTTEGRELAERIADSAHSVYVCVATEYGASLLPDKDNVTVSSVRLSEEDISGLIVKNSFDICIDATHPYAAAVSENVRVACNVNGLKLYRISRENTEYASADAVYVDSVGKAVDYLALHSGNVLITTGSKELREYVRLDEYKSRCYVRVLPVSDVIKECESLGFDAGNILAIKGPFSKDMNVAMLRTLNAKYMVTKASGSKGGYSDKLDACRECGVIPVIVGRPEEKERVTYSTEEIYKLLSIDCDKENKKTAYIVGMGCGNKGLITVAAREALMNSELIIGAARLVASVKDICQGTASDIKEYYTCYNREAIVNRLADSKVNCVSLIYSGDIGFYSGANGIDTALQEMGYSVVRIPGISSVVYLCDVLGYSWNEYEFLSCHGRSLDITSLRLRGDKLAILLGDEEDASAICTQLAYSCDKDNYHIVLGENLSYDNERIRRGAPSDFIGVSNDKLSVLLIVRE